ncbi:hypothetical protein QWZ08_24745 [Ferruginibacter paludis]|nr:hypothetical protein [Ferruginibacter paludis]
MMIVTMIGGLIALKYTVSFYSWKLFTLIYTSLWLLRLLLIFLGERIGTVLIWGREFRFNAIIGQYYDNASRIVTPWPFLIFWFINYLFASMQEKQSHSAKD